MRKTGKRLRRTWLKGARFLWRKDVSKHIILALQDALQDGNQTLDSVKRQVASVVKVSLDHGQACVFFHQKLLEYVRKRKERLQCALRRRAPRRCAQGPSFVIARGSELNEWRESQAMWREDFLPWRVTPKTRAKRAAPKKRARRG